MKVHIALIVAMTPDRVIGTQGKLPWKLPADMRHFKKTTMGYPVIMGRRTWESIGNPLPGRMNIVLTTQEGYEVIGGHVAHSTAQALRLAQRGIIESLAASFENPSEEVPASMVMVIGGEAIYRNFLPVAERIYQTLVHADLQGDTHFPYMDSSEWIESMREDHPADAKNPHAYSFVVLDRKAVVQRASAETATNGHSDSPQDQP